MPISCYNTCTTYPHSSACFPQKKTMFFEHFWYETPPPPPPPPPPHTHTHTHRMKEQVKSRMEILLQQETVARRNSAQASSPAQTSKMASSTTGRPSLSSSTTGSRSSMSKSVSSKRGSMVGARADLLFNVDTGGRTRC